MGVECPAQVEILLPLLLLFFKLGFVQFATDLKDSPHRLQEKPPGLDDAFQKPRGSARSWIAALLSVLEIEKSVRHSWPNNPVRHLRTKLSAVLNPNTKEKTARKLSSASEFQLHISQQTAASEIARVCRGCDYHERNGIREDTFTNYKLSS